LKDQISSFFGGKNIFTPVIPNERLIGVVNDAAEFQPRTTKWGWGRFSFKKQKDHGWLLAQIPVTQKPEDAKSDKVPLTGLAVSFFIRAHKGYYAFELEIFHA